MSLTKKHFIKIAEIVNQNKKTIVTSQLIEDLSDYFITQNINFNREKFKEACLK